MGHYTMEEVKNTLKMFAKEISPGHDGWTLEFYLHFFDLFGHEISEAVEETPRQGNIHEVLNSTYPTLIPKKDQPNSFIDFPSVIYYTKLSQNSLHGD